MLTVACVLETKSGGGVYEPRHVYLLQEQVKAFLTIEHEFICLTDVRESLDCKTLKLCRGWPGWWSKLELFCHDFGPTIYFDLDVLLRKNVDWLVDSMLSMRSEIGVMLDALKDSNGKERVNSSVMVWNECPGHVIENFEFDRHSVEYGADIRSSKWGDQGWIQHHATHEFIGTWRGGIAHRKFSREDLKTDSSILVYSGRPKPWDDENRSNYAPVP